jgi:hypothetical protein
MESLRHFGDEILRVRWLLILSVGVIVARSWGWLPDSSPLTLMLYKPALAAIGFVWAHIAWSQTFYYLEGWRIVREKRDLLALGVFTMRGLIYAAFILAVALGL